MKRSTMLMLCLVFSLAGVVSAQPMGRNVADRKLGAFPGLPTCATGSVENGDPANGPSIIYAKMAPGCTIPWHWHTPNENVMIVTGTATMEMQDGKPMTLRAGAYALMPSHHVHQFTCAGGCTLYIYSDVAFDLHYVNRDGSEISPDEAMKMVNETAAKPPM